MLYFHIDSARVITGKLVQTIFFGTKVIFKRDECFRLGMLFLHTCCIKFFIHWSKVKRAYCIAWNPSSLSFPHVIFSCKTAQPHGTKFSRDYP